uniref:NADH:ubiquinone reductase (H(+)-translocating) n=1 Tax=Brachionus rubens TaxID=392764 RepID=A0A7G3PZ07_9BILA|nr:NADH dehydrogenase subunit 5 [Brachionus rubens]
MTSFYHHLLWFVFLFSLFIVSLLMSVYVSYLNESFYIAFNLFSFWNNDMTVSFYLDYMSMWFSTVILMISSVIMIYSFFYMAPYSKTVYFLWITNLFILSMLLVVNLSNLFFLMLGWDGLGLVSFFLIVYYQNQSSITSGVFTLLMNRLGDSFFLVTIMLFFYYHSDLTSFTSNLPSLFVLLFLMLTFMTKSALYPFSPWLPLAMAAPTPISALVHSSTLVTSGLYLMMRFSYLLYSSYMLMKLLLILSLFTSFYAGMNSIFEKDLKKMIALSTLSHLGFIGMAFSAGLLQLAFFHMLTHALFKSLLFMTMGDIMINLNHSQDIRYLSSGMLYTPMSCLVMYVSILNLLGLPNLSGYFSKDLILEMMNYSSSSILIMLVLFLNVFFTYYYTYQLFYYSFQPIKVFPYQNFHSPMLFHSVCLFLMSVSTLVFGFFFMSHICSFLLYYPVPTVNKWLPLFLNATMFFILFLNGKLFTSNHPLINYYFSNMMYLSNLMLTASSNLYYNLGFMLVKSVEMGLFNYSLNTFTKSSFFQLSHLVLKLAMLNSMKIVLYSSILLVFLNIMF